VTLVEMLVTLAILLLMMTVIVQIFQAATGALNSAQVYQELDNQLRLLDLTIRSDLGGVTCKLTPPNNPKNNTGYLEYGENEFADVQGEDSDDYIRFTAKAPAGQPFTGRMWIRAAGVATNATNQLPQPITITSEYAEIIYFLRNGNLYRRVLLVSPERQSTIEPSVGNVNPNPPNPPFNGPAGFFPVALGGNPVNLSGNQVSWQAVNDLSAHPATTGAPYQGNSVILNALGDLTNRENRFAYQRFSSDFQNLAGALVPGGDGLSDDLNGDNVPDYYPTLYPTVLAPTNNAGQLIYYPGPAQTGLPWPPSLTPMAFPFVFPGAYSVPQTLTTAAYGWIHSPNPEVNIGSPSAPVAATYQGNTLGYLQNLNHNPLDTGDNLSIPANESGYVQTWWGFPTWRETLSPFWNDPSFPVNGAPAPYNLAPGQPAGLGYIPANSALPAGTPLPAMTAPYHNTNPQPYNDGFGSPSVFFPLNGGVPPALWPQYSWEDDLVMTGVRSFDIKAYDNSLAAYADLGWGDDLRNYPLNISQNPNNQTNLPFLSGTPNTNLVGNPGFTGLTPYLLWNNQWVDLINQTFAHEGRMPPLVEDNRYDAQFGAVPAGYYGTAYPNYTGNIGDDNPAVVRLRRVWDSWSTEYTQAPGTGVNPATSPAAFFPAGPPYAPPIYPSYPPPYPAPLRGIQIQIRVTDPANQRVKTLTIRQDFTDKL
jgi:type II secretory pathway pseudopilin PulG